MVADALAAETLKHCIFSNSTNCEPLPVLLYVSPTNPSFENPLARLALLSCGGEWCAGLFGGGLGSTPCWNVEDVGDRKRLCSMVKC